MSNVFVLSFTHLKDKPNGDRALHLLQRIASLVKPIMRNHSWKLPVLAEFFPEQANLLGMKFTFLASKKISVTLRSLLSGLNINGGQKICLRLRPAHDPGRFLDETAVVQTMLHELTHNVHGPHNEAFYKFLSKLQDEYEDLQRSGYAGEGFFSEGKRLGAGVSHNLSPREGRAQALAAAEKRAKTARVLGHGGRLGGAIDVKGLSPRELAARAAERRAWDEKACGSGALADREAAKAAENSIENKVIDLTGDDSDGSDAVEVVEQRKVTISDSRPVKRSRPNPSLDSTVSTSGSTSSISTRAATKGPTELRKHDAHEPWSCSICTLINDAQLSRCDACSSPRPVDEQPRNGWSCAVCGEGGMPNDFWSCSFCGTIKASS